MADRSIRKRKRPRKSLEVHTNRFEFFSNLPFEVQEQIFTFVPLSSLGNLCATCYLFSEIIQNSETLWKIQAQHKWEQLLKENHHLSKMPALNYFSLSLIPNLQGWKFLCESLSVKIREINSGHCYEKNGWVIFISPTTCYEGQWENHKWNKKGRLLSKNEGSPLSTYEGDWVNGARDGHGKEVFGNGDDSFVYDGEWKADVRQGCGRLIRRGTLVYEGDWKNGFMDGKGETRLNNIIYKGDWKENKWQGTGRMIDYGTVYEGEWTGFLEGKGKIVYKDGSTYEGSWKNAKYDGYGVLLIADHQMKFDSKTGKITVIWLLLWKIGETMKETLNFRNIQATGKTGRSVVRG
eukprot:TRINITY_DN8997_c0_g1_i1.p1 TRINITY_DN8997_c0_g1~~TRINITY_DN8997_c0_g1_i1.p1  ORF type:complete len:395 (-),score=55.36 TRINITY_DN8997_c0_g1_i1:176-1225(-)